MDGILYPASLVLLALLAYTFNKSRNNMLALIMVLVGIYMVYSHETGHTATDFKNELVDDLGGSAQKFSKERGTGGYDETRVGELLKNKGE